MKSIKNQIEIKNIIKSHISDGVSVTKFLYWIKNNKEKITELKAQNKLELFKQATVIKTAKADISRL